MKYEHSDRILYSIGKTSEIMDLRQSVLRYWETVFPMLNPHKTPGGTRKYNPDDIDLLKKIKALLYDHKFTIAGARHFIGQGLEINKNDHNREISGRTDLKSIVSELEDIINELNN